jgi:hypothetical protein
VFGYVGGIIKRDTAVTHTSSFDMDEEMIPVMEVVAMEDMAHG